jgi:hypothetical protein
MAHDAFAGSYPGILWSRGCAIEISVERVLQVQRSRHLKNSGNAVTLSKGHTQRHRRSEEMAVDDIRLYPLDQLARRTLYARIGPGLPYWQVKIYSVQSRSSLFPLRDRPAT